MQAGLAAVAVIMGLLVGQNETLAAERVSGDSVDPSAMSPPAKPAPVQAASAGVQTPRPKARDPRLPRARWERFGDGHLWTRVTMSAARTFGSTLLATLPDDIADWCPAYRDNGEAERAAFWTSLLSALARYESTYDPRAVGGGGRWFGLMQIYPPTAEFRGCRAQTGAALRHGPSNLACAVRIMAATVPRDNAIAVERESRWHGLAADWGPMRSESMRKDMQRYTSRQTHCRLLSEVRPRAKPGAAIISE